MTDPNTISIVVDTVQLVAQGDPRAAAHLLESDDTLTIEVERQALLLLVYVLSGDHAEARFAELRRGVLERALDTNADDRDVTAAMEAIGAAQLLSTGDLEGTNKILENSDFPPMMLAFNAISLTGQCIAGWVAEAQLTQFFDHLRRDHGVAA